MSRKIILIKQELLLLVYELNRSGLLAENEKIRPILAQLEKLLLCDLSPSTNDSVRSEERRVGKERRTLRSPADEERGCSHGRIDVTAVGQQSVKRAQ